MVVGFLCLIIVGTILQELWSRNFSAEVNTYQIANGLMFVEVSLLVAFLPLCNVIVRLIVIMGVQVLLGYAFAIAFAREAPGAWDAPAIFIAGGGVLALNLEILKFGVVKLTSKILMERARI